MKMNIQMKACEGTSTYDILYKTMEIGEEYLKNVGMINIYDRSSKMMHDGCTGSMYLGNMSW